MVKKKTTNFITSWLKNILDETDQQGFVIGVSGGVDSAVTSTLCALTDKPVIVLNMPINQAIDQYNRSNEQIEWLKSNFNNVSSRVIDLSDSYNILRTTFLKEDINTLAMANSASRLRMITLYAVANSNRFLVAGTGNKVEDYGIGFFTKYGDGGVDISPIADLLKSEVYELASILGIPNSIQNATPTDGLWDDNRSDEDQIGASYEELEWALNFYDQNGDTYDNLNIRQKQVLTIYKNRHLQNKHKLKAPPVCLLDFKK
tara:strand:+ start:5252 stop:6031 length:780 start_codon:yes stop_codon:yes gene_type:complete